MQIKTGYSNLLHGSNFLCVHDLLTSFRRVSLVVDRLGLNGLKTDVLTYLFPKCARTLDYYG